MNNFSEDLKKVLLAGIGAVATTIEKSKDVVDELPVFRSYHYVF